MAERKAKGTDSCGRFRPGCVVVGVAALLTPLLAACPPFPAAPATPAAPAAPASARRPAPREAPPPVDELAAFFATHRAELNDRLTLPTLQYLAHPQARPPGFVDYRRRRGGAVKNVQSARMFAFQFDGSCDDRVVGHQGRICDSAVYPGALLTADQTKRALAILRSAPAAASWATRPSVRCFDPHHAVVFFDAHGAPVADITVCFECGNFRLAPGPDDERGMTDEEGDFFAETCRERGAGGCPPKGTHRMPDPPPPAGPEVSYEEHLLRERERLLARDHGVGANKRLVDLEPTERRLLCAWLEHGSRGLTAYECKDGRVIVKDDAAACTTPATGCQATVADVAACARARISSRCGVDPPACAKSDACRRGLYLR